MNYYLVVSTDDRSYLDLKNIVVELRKRNLPFFFLYSNSNQRESPAGNLNLFSYDTNVEYSSKTYRSNTLGFDLPFKPTVLLITNENWEPEKSILLEFKQWGTFIGCIENSSWTLNNIKSKLEILSRKTFPSNCIDLFFDHSQWALNSKTMCSWWKEKSVVVGNPKFDDFLPTELPNKKSVIVYGSMEIEHHNRLLGVYFNVKSTLKDWDVLYKPHPSELKDFKNDFQNVNLIETYKEYLEHLPETPYHVGIFSTVMLYPLLHGKNVVVVDSKDSGLAEELNIEKFEGHEFNFWQRVLKFTDFEDFKNTIGSQFIEKAKTSNESVFKDVKLNLILYEKSCKFINKTSNNAPVIKYFEEFNDSRASERVINLIESGY